MKRRIGLMLSILSILNLFLCGTVLSAPKVMRVGTIMNTEHPHQKALEKFSQLVKQKTNGEIEVRIFPNSQLGGGGPQVQNVKLGTQEAFIDSVGWYPDLIGGYALFGTPYALSCEEIDRALAGPIGSALNDELISKHGIRMLSTSWDRAPRHLLSVKPILALADVKGLKLRIPPVPHLILPWKMLGASPTPVNFSEVYLALQQRIVDAVELPLDMIYTNKFHEIAKNLSLTTHTCDNAGFSVNERWYRSLTQAQANALNEAAKEAAMVNNELTVKLDSVYRKNMEGEGVKFYVIDIAPFREACKDAPRQLEAQGLWKKGFYDSVLEYLRRSK